jgi:hypothetical protein
MPRDAVLLLTHSRDVFTIDRVIEALRRRGARPVRFDTDRFPLDHRLSVVDSGGGPRYLLDAGSGAVAGDEIAAVWTRSLWPADLGDELAPEHRDACRKQIWTALQGFLEGLGEARWVSPLPRVFEAENKLRQLRLAARVGLATPRSLVTNDAEAVRSFFRTVDGRMVTKLLAALTRSMGRSGGAFHTSDVGEEDLEDLEGLRFAPMIFQEKVPKDAELRVMYVAGRWFAGQIRAQATAHGATDWRLADVGEVGWEPGSVPEEVAERMRRLMGELGLEAGAFDLIRTPAGEHVFLEVNPLGEWGMLERDLGLPISEAVAEALLGGSA